MTTHYCLLLLLPLPVPLALLLVTAYYHLSLPTTAHYCALRFISIASYQRLPHINALCPSLPPITAYYDSLQSVTAGYHLLLLITGYYNLQLLGPAKHE